MTKIIEACNCQAKFELRALCSSMETRNTGKSKDSFGGYASYLPIQCEVHRLQAGSHLIKNSIFPWRGRRLFCRHSDLVVDAHENYKTQKQSSSVNIEMSQGKRKKEISQQIRFQCKIRSPFILHNIAQISTRIYWITTNHCEHTSIWTEKSGKEFQIQMNHGKH